MIQVEKESEILLRELCTIEKINIYDSGQDDYTATEVCSVRKSCGKTIHDINQDAHEKVFPYRIRDSIAVMLFFKHETTGERTKAVISFHKGNIFIKNEKDVD